jgi:hypothetical protein
MADVTGPISTLPGTEHKVPEGTMCDDHPDRPATHRVQGETDSFGSEMADMCDECYAKYREEVKNADTSGACEWCKNHADKLRLRRDYKEGLYGRVYQVCDECIKKENERVAATQIGLAKVYGTDSTFWMKDIRNAYIMGYDGKPRSLYRNGVKSSSERSQYAGRKTRKFKRQASKIRRKEPIEME